MRLRGQVHRIRSASVALATELFSPTLNFTLLCLRLRHHRKMHGWSDPRRSPDTISCGKQRTPTRGRPAMEANQHTNAPNRTGRSAMAMDEIIMRNLANQGLQCNAQRLSHKDKDKDILRICLAHSTTTEEER